VTDQDGCLQPSNIIIIHLFSHSNNNSLNHSARQEISITTLDRLWLLRDFNSTELRMPNSDLHKPIERRGQDRLEGIRRIGRERRIIHNHQLGGVTG